MTPAVALGIGLLALVGAIWWLVGGSRRSRRTDEANIDRDELARAERELENLDAFADPDDADDHLPDWGPGAPGPGA